MFPFHCSALDLIVKKRVKPSFSFPIPPHYEKHSIQPFEALFYMLSVFQMLQYLSFVYFPEHHPTGILRVQLQCHPDVHEQHYASEISIETERVDYSVDDPLTDCSASSVPVFKILISWCGVLIGCAPALHQDLRDCPPRIEMTSAKAGPPLQCCSVCSVSEKVSRNFGATTCSPCAAFFRRTVALKIRYMCKYNNDCSVAREIRNGCRSCRFQKCGVIGMKKQLVQSKGEKNERLPEYIRKGRENGSEEVVRGFATSIYFARSEVKTESACVSPTPSSNSSTSSVETASSTVCPILDVTPEDLLNYYVSYVRGSITEWKNALCTDSVQNFINIKYIADQNAWNICSNCPGVDLLSEDEIPILLRYCSFTNVWMDSAWMQTTEYSNYTRELMGSDHQSFLKIECCEMNDAPSGVFGSLVYRFHSSVSHALSHLQLDLVEYSALKALCIWKLGLVDFTLTLKIVAQEQYYGLTQALATYYRSEKHMNEMEIAVRIADITLLLGPIFESFCEVMKFYGDFSANR